MAEFITSDDSKLWYEECGSGAPLVMLHPGGADSRAFGATLPALTEHFHVYLIDRRGHGHSADTDGDFTFEQSANDLIEFLERVVNGPARLIGYSDGTTVGIQTATMRPELVPRLVCAAGVFHKDGWMPGVLNNEAEPPAFMAESYGEVSPDGIEHWPTIVKKLAAMHEQGPTLTPDDLKRVTGRVLVLVGDDDEPKFEHTIEFYTSLPYGELAVIPMTSHGVLVEKPELCNEIMADFLLHDPAQPFAPLRRS